MSLAHPLRVALCEVIVDGDDVHALSRERVEIGRQGRDQRLAFARLHFGDTALIQSDAADDLHMIVFEFKNAPRRFPDDRKRVKEDIVQRFALGEPFFEDRRLSAQLRVAHRGVFGFERLDLFRHLVQLTKAAPAVAVEHIVDESHNLTSRRARRRARVI